MKGQGEETKTQGTEEKKKEEQQTKVNDQSNNNSASAALAEKKIVEKEQNVVEDDDEADISPEDDVTEEESLASAEEYEEEDGVVNASLVVNISENSHMNSLSTFSFPRDLNENQSSNNDDSTLSNTTTEESNSIESPLASSRSAPPDLRDYSEKVIETPSVPLTNPAVSSVTQPQFTSTPKSGGEMNGTPTTTKNNNVPAPSAESENVKKKLSVTFADILKKGAEDKNPKKPVYVLEEDEGRDLDEVDEKDLSESVYFSLGKSPQDASQLEESKIDISTREASVTANERSELDLASVSTRDVNGSGTNESGDTLINVSSWNSFNASSDATVTPVATPPQQQKAPQQESILSLGNGSGDHLSSLSDTHNVDDEAADEEVLKINANLLLPNTVTELVASNGVKVYVVGTAHFSEQSQHDVIETIQKLQPTLVVLELCHSRRNILTLDEETILRESADMNFAKVREAINQSGAVQGTLHLLLLSMSAQLTKKLGMAPGGEFRAAVREARNVPNCLLLLGDRPFKVTLSRALAALSLGQKIKLGWQFLTSNDDITKDEIERCKEKDLLEQMMMEMTGEFPAISRVFVSERDTYLAHSLWLAATSTSHPNQGGPIVGVVGMGHVAGIVKNWGQTTEEEIAKLMIIPEPSVTSIIVRSTVKYSFYALIGYGAFRLARRLFDFPPPNFIQSTLNRIPPITTKSITR